MAEKAGSGQIFSHKGMIAPWKPITTPHAYGVLDMNPYDLPEPIRLRMALYDSLLFECKLAIGLSLVALAISLVAVFV